MKLSGLCSNVILEKRRVNRRSKFLAQLHRLSKSQEDLADGTNVDPSTISRYKSGARQPSLDTIRALAKQGVDVVDLFGIKTDSEVQPRAKSINRSKAGASRVSDKMLQASREAQEANRGQGPSN